MTTKKILANKNTKTNTVSQNKSVNKSASLIKDDDDKNNASIVDSSVIPDFYSDDPDDNNDKDKDDDEDDASNSCSGNDIDEELAKKIDEEAKTEYVMSEVCDTVKKYVSISEKVNLKESKYREEISDLKKQMISFESYLINYLEHISEEYIDIAYKKVRIQKIETEKKGPIKIEQVSEALVDGFKKHEVYTEKESEALMKVISDLLIMIENKREKKKVKKLKQLDLEKIEKKKAKETTKKQKADKSKVDKPKVNKPKKTVKRVIKNKTKNIATK